MPQVWARAGAWLGLLLLEVACTATLGSPEGASQSGGSASAGTGVAGAAIGGSGGGSAMQMPLVPGRSPLRRLTRAEYNNTVRDLLNDSSRPALEFEAETLADGFTNNADTQNVDTSLAGQYLTAAEALSVSATKDLPGFLGCDASASDDCIRGFIGKFGQRAWRRPLTTPELEHLLGVFTTGRAALDLPTAVQMVVQVMLLSPHFLYRVELGAPSADAATLALTSWEMASRLSYFLHGSMPDEALFTAAAADALRTPEQISVQAKRLLSATNASAQARLAQFFTEWLHLVNVDHLQKDVSTFPDFTTALGPQLRQETETFVKKTLFEGPGDLTTLLTAPYTYPTLDVAKLYGASSVPADGKLLLNPKQRAGLLTQPALLATFAKASTTDPVHRGKFVWEGLFCGSVPPPPPNANITPPTIPTGTSARQAFEAHRASPACAGCHAVMDPIGLTLENFDALGRWQDTEYGLPIDASGTLVNTDVDGPFVGAVGLAQKLAQSRVVANCVTRQLFRFAFGRYETDVDAPTTDQLTAQLETNQGRILDLAVAMTQVPAFLQLSVSK